MLHVDLENYLLTSLKSLCPPLLEQLARPLDKCLGLGNMFGTISGDQHYTHLRITQIDNLQLRTLP